MTLGVLGIAGEKGKLKVSILHGALGQLNMICSLVIILFGVLIDFNYNEIVESKYFNFYIFMILA
jgi:hypothetical protein